MGLVDVLDEQNSFSFSGRVNVLSSESQYLGALLLREGKVVWAVYQDFVGEKALFKLLLLDHQNSDLKFVPEPELIPAEAIHFCYDPPSINARFADVYRKYKETQKFGPPDEISLKIDQNFVISGPPITEMEFEILKKLTELSNVGDLYMALDMPGPEVTQALISLRKKGAIIVVSEEQQE